MKKLINLCVIAALVLSFSKLHSQDIPQFNIDEINIPYQKFVLDNGLTLIVHEDHKAPIVSVNIWYHVGSKNEKPGKTGFAHLFEHLMFNGSEHYDDDYFQALERIGATDLNGTTNEDRTNYFQNVPVAALDQVLWLESDRMGHLLGAITQEKLDEQRGVVQNEKRQGENRPYGKSRELIAKATYPQGHPYSWTVIGSMEDLDAASLEDVHEWFKNYYGAANSVLVIAGDVKPEEVHQKVIKYFGNIPAGRTKTKAAVMVISPLQEIAGKCLAFVFPRQIGHFLVLIGNPLVDGSIIGFPLQWNFLFFISALHWCRQVIGWPQGNDGKNIPAIVKVIEYGPGFYFRNGMITAQLAKILVVVRQVAVKSHASFAVFIELLVEIIVAPFGI